MSVPLATRIGYIQSNGSASQYAQDKVNIVSKELTNICIAFAEDAAVGDFGHAIKELSKI